MRTLLVTADRKVRGMDAWTKYRAAKDVVGQGTNILVYGSGTGHPRMTKGFIVLAGVVVAVLALVLVLTHHLLLPGGLLILVAYRLLRPRRGVALTPTAVIVFHLSMWNGKPKRVLLTAPPAAFVPIDGSTTGRVSVQLGSECVTFKRQVFDHLLEVVHSQPSPFA
jgi:hypothetical protein